MKGSSSKLMWVGVANSAWFHVSAHTLSEPAGVEPVDFFSCGPSRHEFVNIRERASGMTRRY